MIAAVGTWIGGLQVKLNISLVHFCDSACNMVLDIVDSCSGDLDKGPLLDQGGPAKSI